VFRMRGACGRSYAARAASRRARASAPRTRTTPGSKIVPDWTSSSASASSTVIAGRYGRADVIARNA